jgi:hypothetical protein
MSRLTHVCCGFKPGAEVVGGITLQRSGGLDISDWMAMDRAYRGCGSSPKPLAKDAGLEER